MGLRHLCSELMNVRMSTRSGAEREVVGILEGISSTTACIQLEENPGISTRLRIASRGARRLRTMEGTVTGCHYVPEVGYYVDVRFSRGFRWTPAHYTPQHLLACEPLAARREVSALRAARKSHGRSGRI